MLLPSTTAAQSRAASLAAPIRPARPRATVCHVLHTLNVGGAEVLAARLARGLSDQYRTMFVCLDEQGTLGDQLHADGFDVHVIGRRPGFDFRCVRRLARLLRREQVDIIHSHQYTPFFYSLAARLLYRRPPVLFMEHGRTFPDYPRRKRILASRVLLESRDRVVGVGESVRQALIENEGIAAERVEVIYNGIDLARFQCHEKDRLQMRAELGLSPRDLAIIQVARLDPVKDHAIAVRTIERVIKRHERTRLLIVGDGPEMSAIRELIGQQQLDQYVQLLGLRSDIGRLLAASDVCLLTSKSEGIPLTIIEAMAAGLPVVATDVGGVSEVIEHDITGLLAPTGDAVRLAEHVCQLADSPELRMTLGRAGHDRSVRLFSEAQMHARYVQIYEEMLRV